MERRNGEIRPPDITTPNNEVPTEINWKKILNFTINTGYIGLHDKGKFAHSTIVAIMIIIRDIRLHNIKQYIMSQEFTLL